MKLKTFIILVSIIAFFSIGVSAQDNFSDTIPYQIVHDKIVISLKINGKDAKVVYDSGGKPWIIQSEAQRLGIGISGQTGVSDMNVKTSWQNKGSIAELVISKHCKRINQETIIGPNNGSFKTLGVAGLINNEVFQDVVVTILSRENKLVITPYRPSWVKKTDGIQIKSLTNHAFMIPLQIGDRPATAMFDTGYGGLLVVGNAMLRSPDSISFKKINSLFGINGIGINGIPEPSNFYKVLIPSFRIGQKLFSNYGTVTHALDRCVIGIDLLKYGNVVLDIPRQVFYFYPFEPETVNFDGVPKTWNLSVLPVKKDHFQVSGIWGTLRKDVSVGDKVTGINGKSLTGIAPSQFEIEKMMDDIKSDQAYLTIEKNGKEIKVPMKQVK
ncbi:hypothetical protein [Pedobacter punctiformis]|uniref:PDZ domain-containing protein n=1 Tax=Pedobacter punctiformis TaxID=3004097 RepID=A0ABT4LB40_9SPHI|nr:hypothetical protein [Pedobacter sp. HCMS5-2]MCZ4245128.1 hypothetical protein [Pedobacter sp. HCMS5-2]